MKKILFITFLFFIFFSVKSQNISGKWTGFLYQEQGGTRGKYTFEMKLNQNANQITGISEIRYIDDPSVYGKIELTGFFLNNIFTFEEVKINSQNTRDEYMYWCIKQGTLNYTEKENYAYLQGDWKSINPLSCLPGTIFLKKNIYKNNNTKQGQKEN